MKRAYAERRDALLAALALHGLDGQAGGLAIRLELPPGTDDVALARAIFSSGLSPVPLSPWYVADGMRQPGLLLGVTNVLPVLAEAHVATLLAVMAQEGVRP